MKIIARDGRYVAISSYEERTIVKAAGWRWDPVQKVWWTDDVARAAQLAQYSESCPELLEVAKDAELSRSAAHDVEIPAPEGLDYMPFQKAGIEYARKREG